MNAVFSERVSAVWACNACSLPTLHRDQSEFPEIEPKGRTLAEACDRMLDFLVRSHRIRLSSPKVPTDAAGPR